MPAFLKLLSATLFSFFIFLKLAYAVGPIGAYGDSITAGWPYHDLDCYAKHDCGGYEPPLVDLLSARGDKHPVLNYGVPGEMTGDGAARLGGVLSDTNPDYVLLMEGTNDLFWVDTGTVMTNLASMVNKIIDSNSTPVLATITPDSRGGKPITEMNDRIRSWANDNDVLLADQYAAVVDDWENLHSGDKLHPNPKGYKIIAQTWYDVYTAPINFNISNIILLLLDN